MKVKNYNSRQLFSYSLMKSKLVSMKIRKSYMSHKSNTVRTVMPTLANIKFIHPHYNVPQKISELSTLDLLDYIYQIHMLFQAAYGFVRLFQKNKCIDHRSHLVLQCLVQFDKLFIFCLVIFLCKCLDLIPSTIPIHNLIFGV